MKREVKSAALILLLVVIILFFESSEKEIILNEKFIYNLYHPNNTIEFPKFTLAPDLNNPEEVFEFIFSHLETEVVVYPSENYYYFEFPAEGKLIAGNIALFAHIRDEGKFSFAYFDKSKVRDSSGLHISKEYNSKEGVFVKKISDFVYSITLRNKTVIFKLNELDLNPPKLLDNEIFIGPSFDESGIKFFLLFNNFTNTFYWVLNEQGFVPENFVNYSDIFVGERTGFAFYQDRNRKILLGVNFSNTFNNNWYDGPFDQLPDNYIKTGKIDIKKYIDKAYSNAVNNTDIYGHNLMNPTKRVAISKYQDFSNLEELSEVISNCKKYPNSEFYACITTPITSS